MKSQNTITAQRIIALLIKAGAIESLNYNPAGPAPFSLTGTRLDLVNGDIQTPGLFSDGATGDLAVRGDITAETLTIIGPTTKSIVAGPVVGLAGSTYGLTLADTAWSDPDYAAGLSLGAATPNQAIAALTANGNVAGTTAAVFVEGLVGDASATIVANDQTKYAETIYDANAASAGIDMRAGDTLADSARLVLTHSGGIGTGIIALTGGAINLNSTTITLGNASPSDPNLWNSSLGAAVTNWHANTANRGARGFSLGTFFVFILEFTLNPAIAAGAIICRMPANMRPTFNPIQCSMQQLTGATPPYGMELRNNGDVVLLQPSPTAAPINCGIVCVGLR